MNDRIPHISIIILNWNGWEDTIECLESVYKNTHKNFNVILIDNGSSDLSADYIEKWALHGEYVPINTNFPELVYPPVNKPIPLFKETLENTSGILKIYQKIKDTCIPAQSLIFIQSLQNLGYAGGNNIGIQLGDLLFSSKYFLLLNNDTVIQKDAITNLCEYYEIHPNYGALTAAIYYYSDPLKVHNVGGKITPWAAARYYTDLPKQKNRPIHFVTGCALMISKTTIDKVGNLSEKFFFGEEDFELSWRLKKKKVPVTCVYNSTVYHKVSVAAEKVFNKESLSKKIIYVYSRIINMKDYYSYPLWFLWKIGIYFYSFFWLIIKYKVEICKSIKFVLYVHRFTKKYTDLKKSTLDKILEEIKI